MQQDIARMLGVAVLIALAAMLPPFLRKLRMHAVDAPLWPILLGGFSLCGSAIFVGIIASRVIGIVYAWNVLILSIAWFAFMAIYFVGRDGILFGRSRGE